MAGASNGWHPAGTVLCELPPIPKPKKEVCLVLFYKGTQLVTSRAESEPESTAFFPIAPHQVETRQTQPPALGTGSELQATQHV